MHNYNHENTHHDNGATIFLGIFLLPILWELWIVLKFGFYLGRAILHITPWPNLNGCIASLISLILACSACVTATLIWISVPSINIFHWSYQIATNILAGWILVNIFMVIPIALLYFSCKLGRWLFRNDYKYPLIINTSHEKNYY